MRTLSKLFNRLYNRQLIESKVIEITKSFTNTDVYKVYIVNLGYS